MHSFQQFIPWKTQHDVDAKPSIPESSKKVAFLDFERQRKGDSEGASPVCTRQDQKDLFSPLVVRSTARYLLLRGLPDLVNQYFMNEYNNSATSHRQSSRIKQSTIKP